MRFLTILILCQIIFMAAFVSPAAAGLSENLTSSESGFVVIQGVKNARIKLQNEEIPELVYNLPATDELGETHCSLVSVEWDVRETSIEDKYDIVLTAAYKTDVPAPVVVMEPMYTNLPEMEKGEVFRGELSLANHGLISADNVRFYFPESDEFLKYEFSQSLPETIGPNERITIPYRITSLKTFDSGTGCRQYSRRVKITYSSLCSNGHTVSGSTRHVWNYYKGSNCGKPGSGIIYNPGGGSSGFGGGGSGGGSISGGPSPETIEGTVCLKECDSLCCSYEGLDRCETPSACGHVIETVGSAVNVISGTYAKSYTDLRVKAAGGYIEIKRKLSLAGKDKIKFKTEFEFLERIDLRKNHEDDGSIVYDSIVFNKKIFRLPDSSGRLDSFEGEYNGENYFYKAGKTYRFGRETLKRLEKGEKPGQHKWKWEDIYGSWKIFGFEGELLEFGNRTGVTGRLVYNGADTAHPLGIEDRHHNQVIWFEFDEDRLAAVRDYADRRVEYRYNDSKYNLSGVKDVSGRETLFQQDCSGHKTIGPDNETSEIFLDGNSMVKMLKYGIEKIYKFAYDYKDAQNEHYCLIRYPGGKIKEVFFRPASKGLNNKELIKGRTRILINGKEVSSSIFGLPDDEVINTDENGNQTTDTFNSRGQLVKRVYADGTSVQTKYDNIIRKPVEKTDQSGIKTLYEYNDKGLVTKIVQGAGTESERTIEFFYDENGSITEIKTNDSDSILMEYDESGNMVSITDAEGIKTRYSHDIMGNILTKTDSYSNVWKYEYDNRGNLVSAEDPEGNKTGFEYNASGKIILEKSPSGLVKKYEYDNRGNLTKEIIIPDESDESSYRIISYSYRSDDQIEKITDARGNTSLYEYDERGRLSRATDASGNAITLEYEEYSGSGCTTCSASEDSPSKIVYPTFSRNISYDKLGRITRETLLGDKAKESGYSYDKAGNLVTKTDAKGNTTIYRYDSLNRLKGITDSEGNIVRFGYDIKGNLISLTDANGSTTKFEYYKNNLLKKEISPKGQTTEYEYDKAGRLCTEKLPNSRKIKYHYYPSGRLEKTEYFSKDGTKTGQTRFTYTASGHLKTWDNGDFKGSYEYSKTGEKLSETTDYGNFSKTINYTWYKNGLKKTYKDPAGKKSGYLYNESGILTAIQIPEHGYITLGEFNWQRPGKMSYPGGTSKEFTYDSFMKLKSNKTFDPAENMVEKSDYTYDQSDNITEITLKSGTKKYEYDNLYRLARADNINLSDEEYSYDKAGNRVSSKEIPVWKYNENNELVSCGSTVFTCDANGNLETEVKNSKKTTFVYNPQGRIKEIWEGEAKTGRLTAEYKYDPFGRRLYKKTEKGIRYFLYSDEGLAGEADESGNIVKTYLFKPDSLWGTDPVLMSQNDKIYFYHNDHLGTPQFITSKSGAVVWKAEYSSFGKANIIVEDVENNLRFPGQYFDFETGYHYNWQRYYNPEIGRYLTPDPIGLAGGLNSYTYGHNNPINLIDPDGELAFLAVPAVWGLAELGFSGYDIYDLVNTVSDECSSTNEKIVTTVLFGAGIFLPGGGYGKVQRAMSRAELEATRKTGLLRGGREGIHYVSDAVNTTAKRARQRLGLPVEPEMRVTMEVPKGKFSPPSRVQPFEVQPNRVLPGGGMERTATGDIPVKILDVRGY